MTILRWILILPVSILSSILIPYLYDLFLSIFFSENTFAKIYIVEYVSYFLQGVCFVFPFYLLAPKYKNQVLIISLILLCFFVIIGEYILQTKFDSGVGYGISFIRILGGTLCAINIKMQER